MKKIILLCITAIYCMSGYAITLTASPGSVASPPPGGVPYADNYYVAVTVTASGETSTSHITNVSYSTHGNSVSPSTAQFDGYIVLMSPHYYGMGASATNFTFNLTMVNQSISQNYVVTYFIPVVTSDHSQSFLTFNVTVTPSGIFYNTAACGSFTKSCSAGSGAPPVAYCVPINKYHASSQAAADLLATNDISANGQTYANNNSTCTLCNVITGDYIDGVAIIGGAANITYGEHDFSVTYSGPTVSYSFTSTSRGINFEDYSNVYNSSTNTSTVTAGFYLTNIDPPAPIKLTLTNTCGSNSVTATFTGH